MNLVYKYYHWIAKDSSRGFQLFSICRQAVTFITGIILAMSTLSNTQIGVFEVWMLIGLIISFAGLSGILQGFLAEYGKIKEQEREKFTFNALVLLWAATGILSLIIIGFRDFFMDRIFNLEDLPFLPLVLVFLLLHLNASFTSYIALVKGNSGFFIPYSLFYVIGNVLAVSIPLLVGGQLEELLKSLLVWALIEQIVLSYYLWQDKSYTFSLRFIKILISTAVPLSLYSGAGLFAQIFDAWLVNNHFGDLSVFALYKYGAREVPGAIALGSAFSATMIVQFISDRVGAIDRIRSGSRRLMHFFFPLSIILIFYSEKLFVLLYNESFRGSALVFNAYLLLMISRWIFPQAILVAMGEHRTVFLISLVELLINILLSLWLVNLFGLMGVALGTVGAFWSEKILMMFLLKRKYKMAPDQYMPVRVFMIYSGLLISAFLWTSL